MHPRIEKHIEAFKKSLSSFFPVRPGSILQNFDRENPELLIKFDDPTGREPGFVERLQLKKLYGQVDVLYSTFAPNEETFPNNWNKMIWVDTSNPGNPEMKIYSSLAQKYVPMTNLLTRVGIDENTFEYSDDGRLGLIGVDGGNF